MKKDNVAAKPVVWLIEDHVDSRRILARVLNSGATLQCPCSFASCEEALTAIRTQPAPDVILLDFTMPVMDGVEMLTKLKSDPTLKAIPVMMLTAEGGRRNDLVVQVGDLLGIGVDLTNRVLDLRIDAIVDLRQALVDAAIAGRHRVGR